MYFNLPLTNSFFFLFFFTFLVSGSKPGLGLCEHGEAGPVLRGCSDGGERECGCVAGQCGALWSADGGCSSLWPGPAGVLSGLWHRLQSGCAESPHPGTSFIIITIITT